MPRSNQHFLHALVAVGILLGAAACTTVPRGMPTASGGKSSSPSRTGLMTVEELQARLAADTPSSAIADSPTPPSPAPPAALRMPSASTHVALVEPEPTIDRWIKVAGEARRISVSFLNDPLTDVLTLFANYSGLSIITSNEPDVLEKRLTGDLMNQPWNIALEMLLRAHNLHAYQDQETGVIMVQSESRALTLRDPEIIRLRYVNSSDVIPILRSIIGAGEPGAPDVIDAIRTRDGEGLANTLLIYTSPEKMTKVRSMIAQLDRKRPTVTIQAKMVFVNRSSLEKMGFQYSIVPVSLMDAGDATAQNGSSPGALVRPNNPYQGIGQQGGQWGGQQGGQYGGGMQRPQGGNSAFNLMYTLASSGVVGLNVFFDALSSTGMASVEAAPVITTTSDLEATIRVGEFHILSTPQPIMVAGNNANVMSPWGLPGQYPQGGQWGGQQGGQWGGQQGGQWGGQQGGQWGGPQGGQWGAPPVPGQQYPGGQQYGGRGQYGGGQMGSPGMQVTGNGNWSSFSSGTTLKVTPYVLPNGRVRMKIDISRDGGTLAPDGTSISGGSQTSQTEVTVRSDESIVIGGLTVVERSTSTTGIPVISKLPLFGRLFRTTQAAEIYQDLVIIVTPHVIYDEDDDIRDIRPTRK
jgi:type II secretory pathway component GspD/PulD (secretin)